MQRREVAEVSSREKPKELIPAEEISAEVDELLGYAFERAKAVSRRQPGRAPVRTTRKDKPDISQLLRDELLVILEDEVAPAVEADPNRGILDWELQREVAKKALVGLKLDKLRQLAEQNRLDKRGRVEELAERIARAYRYDDREIAQLILKNEDEPEPERSHVDRIFPLVDPVEADSVLTQLERVNGRYVRVGVARWFVFEALERSGRALTLRGTLQSYKAFVTSESRPGGGVEAAKIGSSPSSTSVEIEVVDEVSGLRIRGASASASRAAANALEIATDCRRLGHLPFGMTSFSGPLGSFADSTVFMLDFIDNRLQAANVSDPNLTVARFEMERGAGGSRSEHDRPMLREVRFEGDHLLDSVAACRLIAVEGRALIDLSLKGTLAAMDEGRFPIRLSLDRDHVMVLTGFGAHRPAMSAILQRALVRAVERALDQGVEKPRRLERLATRIDELARSNREVEKATMLRGDENDADEGEARRPSESEAETDAIDVTGGEEADTVGEAG